MKLAVNGTERDVDAPPLLWVLRDLLGLTGTKFGQFDAGLPHAQRVVRGPAGHGAPGLPCATCHGAANPPAS
jgi:aerobic-type carbon monoxide dehydrogenase small subunit (CoxS/CutS family)